MILKAINLFSDCAPALLAAAFLELLGLALLCLSGLRLVCCLVPLLLLSSEVSPSEDLGGLFTWGRGRASAHGFLIGACPNGARTELVQSLQSFRRQKH